MIVGSLYCSPNTNETPLIEHLTSMLDKIKIEEKQKECILGMDHNLDLLKSQQHHTTSRFLECILDHNILPAIMQPSRITKSSATLIDNIFISDYFQCSFDSCLPINDTTDHLPTLLLAKPTKLVDKEPLEFKHQKLTTAKTQMIKEKLQEVDWIGHLNSDDSNQNFNVFCDILKDTMDGIVPKVTIRISGKWKIHEPWLTPGLERSGHNCQKLYKKTLTQGCA